MDATYSHRLSRLSRLLLAGTGVAFAWVLLSLALGFSAAQAHADDDAGLLGAVTSTVEDTTSTATGVVGDATVGAVQAAAPVVETVATVVAPVVPVAPAVEVAEATVAPVAEMVSEVAATGVVAPIVESTVTVVGTVPVVGDVVASLGADDALSSVGHGVDGVVLGATGAVVGTVTDVVESTGGTVASPGVPPVAAALDDLLTGAVVTRTDAVATAATNPWDTLLRAAYLTGAAAWASLSSDAAAAAASAEGSILTGGAVDGALALLRSVLQADSVLTGSAGAGPGAWVLVALGFVVAYRAWMRRTGLENDTAPPAPAYATDVSPD